MQGDNLESVYEPNHTYDNVACDVSTYGKLDHAKAEARTIPRTSDDVNTRQKSNTCSRNSKCCSRCLSVARIVSMAVCLILTVVNVLLLLSVKSHQGQEHTYQAQLQGTNFSWEWGPWGPCDAICGYGMRSRERYCGNQSCGDWTKDKDICNEGDCVGKPVGFSALLKPMQKILDKGSIVVYKYVDYNQGNGYNNTDGIFTCPQSGVYLFLMFAHGLYKDAEETCLVLKIDGAPVCSLITQPVNLGHDQTGGNAVVKFMTRGQKAWVETFHSDNQTLYAYRTTFSAVLLR